jgi:hypothetical protein
MRITYTGGEGVQRADKMICDYLRMANLVGKISKVEVLTRDKKLISEIEKIRVRTGKVLTVFCLSGESN